MSTTSSTGGTGGIPNSTMLDELLAHAVEGALTTWESEFVDSLNDKVLSGVTPTFAQQEKLEELYERYCT